MWPPVVILTQTTVISPQAWSALAAWASICAAVLWLLVRLTITNAIDKAVKNYSEKIEIILNTTYARIETVTDRFQLQGKDIDRLESDLQDSIGGLGKRLDELHGYTHSEIHALRNLMMVLPAVAPRIDRLENTLSRLLYQRLDFPSLPPPPPAIPPPAKMPGLDELFPPPEEESKK